MPPGIKITDRRVGDPAPILAADIEIGTVFMGTINNPNDAPYLRTHDGVVSLKNPMQTWPFVIESRLGPTIFNYTPVKATLTIRHIDAKDDD